MSLITWQDTFSVGAGMADSEHQILIALINQLHDAQASEQTREVVGSVLNVLAEYGAQHFGHEERMLEAAGYPDLDQHKRLHADFNARVAAIIARHAQLGGQALGQEVLDFLSDWLVGHILKVDMHYRPWVEKLNMTPEEMMEAFQGADAAEDEEFWPA